VAPEKKARRKTKPAPACLDELRRRIDELDTEIVRLINERARCAGRIGELKRAQGAPVFVPAREQAVYERVLKLNKGPLPPEAVRAVYREIMSASLALERCPRVAYLGPAGTFSHKAARSKFGSSVEYHPATSFRDIFLAVARGHADYGVIPVENSTDGGVNSAIDCFFETRLKICSEIFIPVHQNLLSRGAREAIRTIYSRPEVFGQCRQWLGANFPHAALLDCPSTTAAAERASKEDGAAAIGPDTAAELYGLRVVESAVEDNPENVTRFVVIARESAQRTGRDKTSLMFSISDAPGALLGMLEPFSKRGLNLTRIESRPSKKKAWDYYFFVDLDGHADDEPVKAAIEELAGRCRHIEVLGSYPAADALPVVEG
jgi:chorismate mutase / prephenate dehydratase